MKLFEDFTKLIEKHGDGLACFLDMENRVSLEFVEGLNNKIRVLQRRAYGFQDDEYLRIKVPNLYVAGSLKSSIFTLVWEKTQLFQYRQTSSDLIKFIERK